MSLNNNDKPSILDRGTIIALVVTVVFWLAWSKYIESKYPKEQSVATVQNSDQKGDDSKLIAAPIASNQPSGSLEKKAAPGTNQEETRLSFDNEKWHFEVSSKGMGIKNVVISDFKTRQNEAVILGQSDVVASFATGLISTGQPIDFQISKIDSNIFQGKADLGDVKVVKTLTINPENYSIHGKVEYEGGFLGSTLLLGDVVPAVEENHSFMSRSTEFLEWVVLHEGSRSQNHIDLNKGGTTEANQVSIAALSSHYFSLAVVDHSDVLPQFRSSVPASAQEVQGALIYDFRPAPSTEKVTLNFIGYAGPKKYDILEKIDESLPRIIDYGMFFFIAKPMLWLMKALFSIFSNWGIAIIVLTIIVRLIVLPFNVYSYKSMKAMQRIQPEMNRIRENYKDKPADQKIQMNQEIMELMKRNQANPLGGCLPMLLQLPVFFALYQVLGQSIELYQAPFGLWIHDLSAKDPLFVLPVLMAITMFIQQKITPSTMDPQQAKIMQWMPVIFAFFMLGLPSGLTLYIFVSTLFGIIQQYIFMKDKKPVSAVKAVKA